MLFWLALLISSIAVQTRRLHDTNRSGWWLGAFYLIYAVYLMLLLASVGSVMGAAMTGVQPDPSQAFGPMFIVTMIVALAMFVYAIVLLVFYCQEGISRRQSLRSGSLCDRQSRASVRLMQDVSPLEWAVRPFRKYADFTGRAPRAEYWWFYLGTVVVQISLA